jgi:hypothetical protein
MVRYPYPFEAGLLGRLCATHDRARAQFLTGQSEPQFGIPVSQARVHVTWESAAAKGLSSHLDTRCCLRCCPTNRWCVTNQPIAMTAYTPAPIPYAGDCLTAAMIAKATANTSTPKARRRSDMTRLGWLQFTSHLMRAGWVIS